MIFISIPSLILFLILYAYYKDYLMNRKLFIETLMNSVIDFTTFLIMYIIALAVFGLLNNSIGNLMLSSTIFITTCLAACYILFKILKASRISKIFLTAMFIVSITTFLIEVYR